MSDRPNINLDNQFPVSLHAEYDDYPADPEVGILSPYRELDRVFLDFGDCAVDITDKLDKNQLKQIEQIVADSMPIS